MNAQKTVWVTGASSGLGLHTAMALRDDGWQVIAGARSFTGGQRDGMTCLPLDVTDAESVRAFCRRAAEIAPPDALVQCAGMLVLGSCEETETEEFRRVMDTNYLGMVRMNREVLPLMRRQGGGKIVLFSSINGLLDAGGTRGSPERQRQIPSSRGSHDGQLSLCGCLRERYRADPP